MKKVPVLLIHGNPGSAKGFDTFRDILTAKGIKSFAFTLPGFGGRPMPPGENFHLPSQADDLWRQLDEAHKGPVVLAGHSHGASVALVMAGQRPEQTRGVCLMGGAGLVQGNYVFMNQPIVTSAVKLLAPLVDELELDLPIARHLARNAMGAVPRRINPALLTPVDGQTLTASFLAARDWSADDIRQALTRYHGPLTIIHGNKDKVVPPHEIRTLIRAAPRAEVRWISGGGHSPHLDVPDQAAEAILRLVTQK